MNATLTTLLLCLSLAVSAPALANESGQVDLSPLSAAMEATPKVNLAFGPAMMAGFAESLRQSSPELGKVLGSVKGLRVMVYEGIDQTAIKPQVADMVNRLGEGGWSPALTVRDGNTEVDLFLIESDQYVKGLTLLVRDGDSTAVFANIHGDLDPVVIGKLIGSGKAMDGLDFGELMGQFQQQANGEEEDPNDTE